MNRFFWLQTQLQRLPSSPKRIIELGCYDGRSLDFLPAQPDYYLGLDAGWEGGLAIGQKKFADARHIDLRLCQKPGDIPDCPPFDVGICLETMEHMNYDLAESYLRRLRAMIRGYLFVTVPREHGLIFPFKYAMKHFFFTPDDATFSWRDIWLLTFGQTAKVQRKEHKGFDERVLIKIISRHFRIEAVTGIFPPHVPRALSFAVGIVARSDT